MGIQPGALFPARSAVFLPATLYGHYTQAIYRNRPILFRLSLAWGLHNIVSLLVRHFADARIVNPDIRDAMVGRCRLTPSNPC